MDHIKGVLEKFGQHTRQSDEELLDTSKIAQKYVAVHIGDETTYNCVSNDYNALKLRTHNPPLSVYAQHGKIDVPTFVGAMSSIAASLSEGPVFQTFQHEFFPKPHDQEKWQWLERPDQWKEPAAFVAMTMYQSPKFGEMVDAIGAKGVDRYKLKQFMQKHQKDSVQIAHEVGTILSQIKMPENLYLGQPLTKSSSSSSSFSFPFSEGERKKNLITLDKKGPLGGSGGKTLADLRPLMEPYRVRAGLNKTFNTEKLAKQIMISALNVPSDSVPTSILSRHQESVQPLVNDKERQLASTLVDAFESEPDFDPNKSARCQAMSKATLNNMWEPRTLLKHVLHAPNHVENGRHLESYNKSGVDGTEDEELARAIEEL